MLHLATILHPTDFSEHSDLAYRLACALARDYNARLILLHVISPSEAQYGGTLASAEKSPRSDEVKESLREMEESHWRLPCPANLLIEQAKEKLRQMEEQGHRVRVESQVMEGDSVGLILRAAEETNSDLIVMGTHGRTAFSRLLMGSVAEEVLRKAPCPVLTAKPVLGRNRLVEDSEAKAADATKKAATE